MKKTFDIAVIAFGALLLAVAFNLLLIPHHLLSGGLSGISLIVGYVTHWDISLLFLISNLPLAIWGWIVLGRRFIIYSSISVGLTVWFMQIVPVSSLAEDSILSSVFGGVLLGIATGISLRVGGSTGGFDIIASIIIRKRDFPLGTLFIGVNGIIVFALGYFEHNWELALSSMLSMYVAGKIVDVIHIRHVKVTAFIVTKQKEALAGKLLNMPRGVTVMKSEGAYTHTEGTVLMTVITRYELVELKRIIKETDPEAFVNIVETVDVLGKFRRST